MRRCKPTSNRKNKQRRKWSEGSGWLDDGQRDAMPSTGWVDKDRTEKGRFIARVKLMRCEVVALEHA